ncbi:MAG: hypothetical protein ABUL62_14790 [Myxococcales bacterium]
MIARYASSLLCMGAFSFCLLRPGQARAQPVAFSISLDYTVVSGCPGAAEFQAMVVTRLGYDPFSEGAQKHVAVHIAAQGTALEGRTEWRDATGKWSGDQSFRTTSSDCLPLTRTMGLALAVQLQLLADTVNEPAPAVTEREPPAKPKSSPTEPGPPLPHTEKPANDNGGASRKISERPLTPIFALGAGASVGFGMASTPVVLGRSFAKLAWQHLSLQLGPELSTQATTRRADGAGFTQQILLLSAAGCWLVSPVNACLVFNAGQVRMEGQDIDRPGSARLPIVEAGARVGIEQPIGSRVFVNAHLDGLAVLARRTATLDGVPVWSTPPFAAALGLDVGLRFP